MWFKNLRLFRLKEAFDLNAEELAERLNERASRPCESAELSTFGWTAPLGRLGSQLTHAIPGHILICARREEKIIPPAVVNQLMEDRIDQIEKTEAREVRRKEKQRLKDEIMIDLMPRAFARHADTYAWINIDLGMILVDAASASKAEDVVSLLRKTLGSFPAQPVDINTAAIDAMTRWLNGHGLPDGFELGESCELRHPDPDGGIVTIKKQDLSGSEVQKHLELGKFVNRLQLNWSNRLDFTLNEDLGIKSIRFADVVKEDAGDLESDDPIQNFDQNFALCSAELSALIKELGNSLGYECSPIK